MLISSPENFQLFYSGIPYLSRIQEEDLRRRLKDGEIYDTDINSAIDFRSNLDIVSKQINEWYPQAYDGDCILLNDLSKKYQCDIEFRYFFLKYIRRNFDNIWIYLNNEEILTLKKVSTEEMMQIDKNYDLNEEIIDSLLGFTKVYKLLVSLKKPIIAHNALMDILILITNFQGKLPDTYEDFKQLTTKLFPNLFDTKHIYYNIRKRIPEKIHPSNTDLKTLFGYFKDGSGRHIAMHSPAIDIQADRAVSGKFHNAGWDSFCSGYIFIRLAYIEIYKKYVQGKIFMPVEYLRGMLQYKNQLNVIRGSVNHIVSYSV